MKYYVSLLALLCCTSILFTSCGKESEDLGTPTNTYEIEVQNLTHEAFATAEAESNEKVCKADNDNVDAPVPALEERIFAQCDEYSTQWYNPLCDVILTDTSLFIRFFPTKGKFWAFRFCGYGGEDDQGFFSGKGVPGGGGTCHFTIDAKCYQTIVGELYQFEYNFDTHEKIGDGKLIARSIYYMRGCSDPS